MPNPVDFIPDTVPVQVQFPRKQLAERDTVGILRKHKDYTRVLAKITALSPENYGDQFVADLYADGRVSLTAPEDTYKTHEDIIVHNPDTYTTYAVGDVVFVSMNPDYTGVILPPSSIQLKGQYQNMVCQMVSDNQLGFNYVLAHAM